MEHNEPYITINHIPLNTAQAMTVRVAIGNFLIELSDEEFVKALGAIGPLYKERLIEISRLMHKGA